LHSLKKSSIFVADSYCCITVHMQDLLTTDEAATYLRLSERKLYELAAGLLTPALAHAHAPAPPIVGGSPRSASRVGTARECLGFRQPTGLDFVPLTWERFDLALHQRDYFLPGLQALFKFIRTATFRERASELTRYGVRRRPTCGGRFVLMRTRRRAQSRFVTRACSAILPAATLRRDGRVA
jgi:PBP superfamily domain